LRQFFDGTGKYALAEQEVKHFPFTTSENRLELIAKGDFLEI